MEHSWQAALRFFLLSFPMNRIPSCFLVWWMVSRCVVNSFCSCTSFKHRIQIQVKHILGASSQKTTVGEVNWKVPITSSMNLSKVPATSTPLASVRGMLAIQVRSRRHGILLLCQISPGQQVLVLAFILSIAWIGKDWFNLFATAPALYFVISLTVKLHIAIFHTQMVKILQFLVAPVLPAAHRARGSTGNQIILIHRVEAAFLTK